MTPKSILAAVGQLPQDSAVLARAWEVARTSNADLRVVHVLDLDGDRADLGDITTFQGQAAFAARDRIELALAEVGADPSEVGVEITLGSHAIALIDLCDALAPDLIVMRAHQKAKIKDRILGSTTERVIAAGSTPVLVVKRAVAGRYDRVVVATNGTDRAGETTEFLFSLLPQAHLGLAQVVQVPPQLEEAMLRVGTRAAELEAIRARMKNDAREHLRQIVEASGRPVTTHVSEGNPAKTLKRMCRAKDLDLLVLGQGKSSLIRRAFIGSVSRRLLRDATCDVLIWSP